MRLTLERLAAAVDAGEECRAAFIRLAEGMESCVGRHLESLPKDFLREVDILLNDVQIRPAVSALTILALEKDRLRSACPRAEKNRKAVANHRERKKHGAGGEN